ncbi:DNA polymerase III subunit beta [Kaistia algarum]|uniref:DNA polymerase III subunit beta n=1 Tax=Kaistia algarum TaxID=2083279 RepID=UPI000CE75F4D|nr:DNA polymerase III subunit beta [Kaistia algarum]MCX5513451.1 DNA polymerase III subunit beta [Kaistia algarum]PPE77451.1 DNA polymerase III subunit beta [Kaistia algarum]
MQITLPRAALNAALDQVKKVVERRNTIPILSNVLLTATAAGLSIKGTDLDIEIVTRIDGTPEALGATTAPAGLLSDIVRKMPDKSQVTLCLDPAGTSLRVESGRARMDLNTLPASDYPDITVGEFPVRFSFPAATLTRMIARTAFAISTEETRYYLNGLYWHVSGDHLVMVATDGHRLAKVVTPRPSPDLDFAGIIAPAKTIARLHDMAKGAEGDLAIEISETKIRVAFGASVLTSKLIDGTFPDYQRVIPRDNDKRLTVDRATLAEAIDRVSTVASERGRAVKLNLQPDSLQLQVHNADSGTGDETLDVTYADEPIAIGFNSLYVGDALKVLDSKDVCVALANPGAPALLTNPQDDSFLIVLMPMRV